MCNGQLVRTLLAEQPGAADALLTAAAQKLGPALEDDQKAVIAEGQGAASDADDEEEL
jgi:hypothetical protein